MRKARRFIPKYEELRENLYSGNEKTEPVSAPLADRYLIELLMIGITPPQTIIQVYLIF